MGLSAEDLTYREKFTLLQFFRFSKSPKAHFPVEAIMSNFPSELGMLVKDTIGDLRSKGLVYKKGDSYGLTRQGWKMASYLWKKNKRKWMELDKDKLEE